MNAAQQRRVIRDLIVVQKAPVILTSRFNNHTPAARGKVLGPEDRRRRDELGEKLYLLWKSGVQTRRETGQWSGPFAIRDWERA